MIRTAKLDEHGLCAARCTDTADQRGAGRPLKRAVYLREKQGIRRMTEEDRTEILEQNQRFSGEGLRVLAFAYRELKESEELTLSGECDYIFLGLVAMIDPPHAESAAAVADAKRAGIRPVMITGDHKVTATAIAKADWHFRGGGYRTGRARAGRHAG